MSDDRETISWLDGKPLTLEEAFQLKGGEVVKVYFPYSDEVVVGKVVYGGVIGPSADDPTMCAVPTLEVEGEECWTDVMAVVPYEQVEDPVALFEQLAEKYHGSKK